MSSKRKSPPTKLPDSVVVDTNPAVTVTSTVSTDGTNPADLNSHNLINHHNHQNHQQIIDGSLLMQHHQQHMLPNHANSNNNNNNFHCDSRTHHHQQHPSNNNSPNADLPEFKDDGDNLIISPKLEVIEDDEEQCQQSLSHKEEEAEEAVAEEFEGDYEEKACKRLRMISPPIPLTTSNERALPVSESIYFLFSIICSIYICVMSRT